MFNKNRTIHASVSFAGDIAITAMLMTAHEQIKEALLAVSSKFGKRKMFTSPLGRVALEAVPTGILWALVKWAPLGMFSERRRELLAICRGAVIGQCAAIAREALPRLTSPLLAACLGMLGLAAHEARASHVAIGRSSTPIFIDNRGFLVIGGVDPEVEPLKLRPCEKPEMRGLGAFHWGDARFVVESSRVLIGDYVLTSEDWRVVEDLCKRYCASN